MLFLAKAVLLMLVVVIFLVIIFIIITTTITTFIAAHLSGNKRFARGSLDPAIWISSDFYMSSLKVVTSLCRLYSSGELQYVQPACTLVLFSLYPVVVHTMWLSVCHQPLTLVTRGVVLGDGCCCSLV